MNLKYRLAYKYVVGKNKYFFSFSYIIAFLGIIIGLFSLIIVSSVMNGLSTDMTNRIISTKGELRIVNKNYQPFVEYETLIENLVNKYPQLIVGSPVNREDLLISRKHYTAYTETFGIDYNKQKEISNILETVKIGFPDEKRFKDKGILIGLDIAFNIMATIGDTIEIISPAVMTPSPFGMIPKTDRYTIIGIFTSGLPEFDRLYSFIDIENSKNFKKHNGVDYIEFKTNIKKHNYEKIANQIEKDYPDLKVEHWAIFDKTLFQAIKIEKYAMFVVMLIIIVLASFNITGNFIRTVTEKKSELAILKTLGMKPREIFEFFLIMSLLVCSAGIFIADLLAVLLLFLQKKYDFIQIPIPGFPFTAVPVDLNFFKIFYYSCLTAIICLIGSLYPAYKTMKIDIITILHDENN